jgi:integrase
LLANAETEDIRLISMAAVLTGMRRGELFGLRWEDVDFKSDVIHVRQALFWQYGKHTRPVARDLFTFVQPKSEASIREIDLSPTLKREFRERYLASKKTGLVFHAGDALPIGSRLISEKRVHQCRHGGANRKSPVS